MLPILLLGVCERAAASEFDSFAGAIVSVLAAVTTVAAAGDGAPCASVARSMSSTWSDEATRTALPSITSSLGVTCDAPFKVLSLAAGLAEACFFAAGGRFCFRLARIRGLQEMHQLANRFRCGLRHALTAKQSTNEQAANRGARNDANYPHCILRVQIAI